MLTPRTGQPSTRDAVPFGHRECLASVVGAATRLDPAGRDQLQSHSTRLLTDLLRLKQQLHLRRPCLRPSVRCSPRSTPASSRSAYTGHLFGAQAPIFYGLATIARGRRCHLPSCSLQSNPRLNAASTRSTGSSCARLRPTISLPGTSAACRSSTPQRALPVDVVLAGPGLEEQILDRAEPRPLDAVRVPVGAVEDLRDDEGAGRSADGSERRRGHAPGESGRNRPRRGPAVAVRCCETPLSRTAESAAPASYQIFQRVR